MSVIIQQQGGQGNNKSKKHITHAFLSGKLSSILIIPIQIARKYGLDKPSNVVVEHPPDGILFIG